MLDILVLALGAAFYPTLLAIVLVVLTRPRPARLLSAYLVGGMLAGLGIGFTFVFVLDGAGIDAGSDHKSTASSILDIVAGVLSLTFAAMLAKGRDPRPKRLRERRKPRDPDKPSFAKRAMSRDSLAIAFALGVVLNLPSVWYLIALKDIVNGGYSHVEEALLIIVFNVIMFAAVEIPLVLYVLAPDRTASAVAGFNAWMRAHAPVLAEIVATVLGIYLIVKGVASL